MSWQLLRALRGNFGDSLLLLLINDSSYCQRGMFDVSFAEVLVVVTGAGLLLGKREILQGSRLLGNTLGRGVGYLHGVRAKYEQKSQGTRVYEMHKNVKMGLQDMGTIGRDLQMVGTGESAFAQAPMSAPISAPVSVPMGASTLTMATPTVANDANDGSTARLAHLILVEEKLQGKDWEQTGHLTHNSDTSDVVQSAITGSIMNSYYSAELQKAERAEAQKRDGDRRSEK